jgi:hypothetical protein
MLEIIFSHFRSLIFLALPLSSAASYDAILGAGAKSLEIVDEMTLLKYGIV